MNKLKSSVFSVLAIIIMVVGILQGADLKSVSNTGPGDTETTTYIPNGVAGFSASMITLARNVKVEHHIGVEDNGAGGLVKASYEDTVTTGSAIETPEEVSTEKDEVSASEKKKMQKEVEVFETEPLVDVHKENVSKTLYVKAASLNVRDKADKSGNVVKKLAQNTKVSVTKKITVYIDGVRQPVWYKLKGSDGYVAATYLSEKPVPVEDTTDGILLGTYRITYYCNCAICCGRVSYKTASGAPTVEGVTIAADPSIPFGTKLRINGHVYTVQDRGGAIRGNHIDIYVSSHSKALAQTYTRGPVYKVN